MTKSPGTATAERESARGALLDAAERLLVEVGHAGITTRRLAEEAGVNHGLVHYYFGSMENVLAETLERFTERLIGRQREMYTSDRPFVEKWREAMRFMEADQESGYQKVWLELHALAWNRPELRGRLAHVIGEWRGVLTEAFRAAQREYGVDDTSLPVAVAVTFVETSTLGMMLERHNDIREGQQELQAFVERWLESLGEGGADARAVSRRGRVRRS
ncbi:MAG: TetR/AcrR family transcriptional regulator [Actinomycetota bacterium]